MIKILINGKELLKKKNIRPEVVTVELNEKIIDRKDYQLTFLKEGDKLDKLNKFDKISTKSIEG